MYESETKALFSHRPDIKAKRNYISTRKKETEINKFHAELILNFLIVVIFFVLACLIMMYW